MSNDGIYSLKIFSDSDRMPDDFPISMWVVNPGCNQSLNFHRHDFREIAIVTDGEARHLMDGDSAKIRRGDVLIIQPGKIHAYSNTDAMEKNNSGNSVCNRINGEHFKPVSSLGLINILYDSSKLPLPLLDGRRINGYDLFFPRTGSKVKCTAEPALHLDEEELRRTIGELKLLDEELHANRPGNMLVSIIRLYSILLEIMRAGEDMLESQPRKSYRMRGILDYLDNNFTRNISSSDIARRMCTSVRNCQRIFKKVTGYSPLDYLIRNRLEYAAKLLTETDLSIAEITMKCGFNDWNYFSDQFHRVSGVSPREYRKMALNDPLNEKYQAIKWK